MVSSTRRRTTSAAGAATATKLAKEYGVKVALFDLNEEKGEAIIDEAGSLVDRYRREVEEIETMTG